MKKAIIIVSVVLALAIAGVAAFFIFNKAPATPLEKIENAIEKNIKVTQKANADYLGKNESFMKNGSVELSADLEQLMKLSGLNMDLDAMFKVYMDTETSKFAEELAVRVNGQNVIDALLALNSKNVSVKSDAILGNKVYGVTYADFFDKFDDSVFGPDGAYSLGISSDELKEQLTSGIKDAFETAFNSAQTTAELEGLADNFAKEFKDVLYTSLETNAKFVEADGKLVVAGAEIETNDISIILTEDQFIAVLLDVMNLVKESENFKKLFIAAVELSGAYPIYDYTDANSTLDHLETITKTPEDMYNDLIKGIDEEIESLNDEITETDDETEAGEKENTITFTFRISKDNKEFIGLDTELIDGEEIYNMEFKFGPSAADIDQIVFVATNDDTRDNAEPEGVTLEYIVSEDSDDSYKASINISSVEYYEWSDEIEEAKEAVNVTLEWDKQEYDYSLEIEYTSDGETEKVTLGGIFKPEEDKETLTITTIGSEGITFKFGEIKIVTRYSDTVPEIPEFTEVLDLTEDEVEDIVTTFEELVSALETYFG